MSVVKFRAGDDPQIDARNGGNEITIVFRDGNDRATIEIEAHSQLVKRVAADLRHLASYMEETVDA